MNIFKKKEKKKEALFLKLFITLFIILFMMLFMILLIILFMILFMILSLLYEIRQRCPWLSLELKGEFMFHKNSLGFFPDLLNLFFLIWFDFLMNEFLKTYLDFINKALLINWSFHPNGASCWIQPELQRSGEKQVGRNMFMKFILVFLLTTNIKLLIRLLIDGCFYLKLLLLLLHYR